MAFPTLVPECEVEPDDIDMSLGDLKNSMVLWMLRFIPRYSSLCRKYDLRSASLRSLWDGTKINLLYLMSKETIRRLRGFSVLSRRGWLALSFLQLEDLVIDDLDDIDAVVIVSVSSFSSRRRCCCRRRDRLKGRLADRISSWRRFLSISSSFDAEDSRASLEDGGEDDIVGVDSCFTWIFDCSFDDIIRQTMLLPIASDAKIAMSWYGGRNFRSIRSRLKKINEEPAPYSFKRTVWQKLERRENRYREFR